MKKVLFISILCLLITTGCGEKKLTCERKKSGGTEKYILKFEDNKVKSLDMLLTANENIPKETCEYIKNIYKDNVKCNDKTMKIKIDDITKMDFYKPNEDESYYSYETMKKEMTDDGFSCK